MEAGKSKWTLFLLQNDHYGMACEIKAKKKKRWNWNNEQDNKKFRIEEEQT